MVKGCPDVNCVIDGVESWIEIKSPRIPVRRGTPLFGSSHKLSAEQLNWIKRQDSAGGNVYVLIATEKFWALILPEDCDIINESPAYELWHRAAWKAETPIRKNEEWMELRNVLRRRHTGIS